ncbi:hypothetical protein GCM10027594_11720 [Hymenobacter agri]
MKTYLLFLGLSLVGTPTIYAQQTAVPPVVLQAFVARFPTAQPAAWRREMQPVRPSYEYETHGDFKAREAFSAQEVYEATFQLDGRKTSVVITPAGLIQETETDLAIQAMPAAVRAALARDFEAYQVQEAATIVRADGSTVYEAEVAQAGRTQDVLFTADGRQAPQ